MTHERLVEWFACQVCGKPDRLTPDECHASHGGQSGVCSGYDHCRIREKSEEQLEYAKSPIDQSIFLKACPGSGKTEVVGLKAAYEIKNWSREVGGIAVLTFTNNAASVIHERVCQFAGIEKAGYPHFIGTLSSWLQGYVANPFAHLLTEYRGVDGDRSIRLVEADCDSSFLKRFQTQAYPQSGPIKANAYSWDCEERRYTFHSRSRHVDMLQNKKDFTADQLKELKDAKRSFMSHGFASHQDIEFICHRLLEECIPLRERISHRFPLIVVDECQDLSWTEMSILRQLQCHSTVLHFVGDLNQAIYEFKKVSPEKVGLFVQKNDFRDMALTDNFRSCQGIVDTCRALVPASDNTRGICPSKLRSPCVFVTYKSGMISSLPAWFEQFVRKRGLDIQKAAIVARGWSTIAKLRPSGSSVIDKYQERLAMSIHLWKVGGIQAMTDALAYMGRFISEKGFSQYRSNSREYYCPDCVSSSVRWRLFLAQVLDSCIGNTNIANLAPTWSAWGVHVRNNFAAIVRSHQPMLSTCVVEPSKPFHDLDSKTFRAPLGIASKPVIASLGDTSAHTGIIRITTIHAVKGETMEAIMLVSAPSKQGTSDGHWHQWLGDPSSEAARFAYVASSRPQHLLVWAVPEEKNADYTRLEKLGFVQHTQVWGNSRAST